MKEDVEIKYNGLKCDNKDCNYHNPDIERKDFESYINSYCPDCGDCLLTLGDYMNLIVVEESVRLTNSLDFPSFSPENEEERINVKINTHKTITFENGDKD